MILTALQLNLKHPKDAFCTETADKTSCDPALQLNLTHSKDEFVLKLQIRHRVILRYSSI